MTGSLTPEQQKLVADHMPYVRALVAQHWQQSDAELQADLVQQGYLALVDAALRYDPIGHPTTTFIGYAKWRVRKYIGEYVHLNHQIRPPWHKIKQNIKPSVTANVPLDDVRGHADLRDEYQKVDDEAHLTYVLRIWYSYGVRITDLYQQWMSGEIEWDNVTDEDQELLFQLDKDLHA